MPKSDFPSGSKPIFLANFQQWARVNGENGSAGWDNGQYVFNAKKNSWLFGGGQDLVTPLQDDFVVDANFTVARADPTADLRFSFSGNGSSADVITIYISIEKAENQEQRILSCSVEKGWINNHYYIVDKNIPSYHQQVENVEYYNLSKPNKLTLKREHGSAHVFVNDHFVRSIAISTFPVSSISVGALGPAKIVLTNMEARIPK